MIKKVRKLGFAIIAYPLNILNEKNPGYMKDKHGLLFIECLWKIRRSSAEEKFQNSNKIKEPQRGFRI